MKTQAQLTINVGCVHYSAVRAAVRRCKFEGFKLEVYEGSGMLSREFILKGDLEAIEAVQNWVVENEQAS